MKTPAINHNTKRPAKAMKPINPTTRRHGQLAAAAMLLEIERVWSATDTDEDAVRDANRARMAVTAYLAGLAAVPAEAGAGFIESLSTYFSIHAEGFTLDVDGLPGAGSADAKERKAVAVAWRQANPPMRACWLKRATPLTSDPVRDSGHLAAARGGAA